MHYWIVINDNTHGPMTLDELLKVEGLTPQTPVWFDGLANWTTIGQVPDLLAKLMQPRQAEAQQASPVSAVSAYPQVNQAYGASQSRQNAAQNDPMRPCPPNHLVWAIIVTVCCCLPAGVAAIVYASKVQPLWRQGRFDEADDASEKAMWWTIGGFVGGLVFQPFIALFQMMSL